MHIATMLFIAVNSNVGTLICCLVRSLLFTFTVVRSVLFTELLFDDQRVPFKLSTATVLFCRVIVVDCIFEFQ